MRHAPCSTGRVLLVESVGGERAIPRPAVLRNRREQILGQVEFHGYLDEVQVVSVLEPLSPAIAGNGPPWSC